jgi:CDP-paratose 2-epimerase
VVRVYSLRHEDRNGSTAAAINPGLEPPEKGLSGPDGDGSTTPSHQEDTMSTLLVTGANGLIGSEIVTYFDDRGWRVVGIDNNMRQSFFGAAGDTRWNQKRLQQTCRDFTHLEIDIRDRDAVLAAVKDVQPELIVHAAAQPSHDLAASRPFDDFDVNAVGTLNLLEAVRRAVPEAVFAHMSTNKVYGDRPNTIPMQELETRWDYADDQYADGIDETMSIDGSLHSLFGASKVAADIMVQEYGRYFDIPTCCLRGGCLTGPNHSGVELHGFLSYLVRCNLEEREYTIFGYGGKQVRDNIHSYDVARCIEIFYQHPGIAEVFNLGGGRGNSISILEAFARTEAITGKPMRSRYLDQPRRGDHICYISDLSRMHERLPGWHISKSLDDIFEEIVAGWQERLAAGGR